MEIIKSFTFGGFPSRAVLYDKQDLLPEDTALFVADSHTKSLISRPEGLAEVILTPGEEGKQWDAVDKILKLAMKEGLARDSVICGAGGGVVTDMTAFAGSLYMRGCRVILIPTSLLAMVDAALGGKTGIDAGVYKNMIGSFYPAEEVRICPEILGDLPEKEYRNGLGEVLKTAIIGDAALLNLIKERRESVLARDPEVLAQIIRRCILVKGALVEEDLREKGRRAFLNLGHTFGHALEAVSEFRWSHGAGVVWGMGKALEASVRLGLAKPAWADEMKQLFLDYGYELEAPEDPVGILEAMKMDKKKQRGKLRYILPAGPQDIRIEFLDPDFVLEVLKA
ncbi:3-dehydroquinate synthase family protein [Oceanispirochaeta sp.]|jgi:3-dehydroquinate synthase|uniref:3-dehydroquinate synthase n=1 Tax=Oceanispirochaeta sp. TaxID=2035350 RepID=UPI00262F1A14|nr:3-dehydroquinate synthase family protein [Oceanispirochaeta sp.]MDA3958379.1 3-dehydroquinate synthase [Oceanispirochaeta sp.]